MKIAEANELIRSRQEDLTILEAKLIRLAIAQIISADTEIYTYSCNVADLAKYLGMDKDNIYRDMRNFAVNLLKKTIFIKTPTDKPTRNQNYKIFHWIDYAEYKDGVITFKLSDSLKPYLIGLSELFTLYGYTAILELPTNNAIKLYELLLSYRNLPYGKKTIELPSEMMGIPIEKHEYIFTVDWLREYFNCEKKYKNTNDFVRWIIDTSIIAISKIQNADNAIYLTYRTVKSGRKITHIIFKYHQFKDKEYKDKISEIMNNDR
jgi:plasmid replication initiation protein